MATEPPAPSRDCPFCAKLAGDADLVAANEAAFAIPDGFPLSPGHTLVLPRRHVAGYFELSSEEKAALWALVDEVRDHLVAVHQPDGFNLGVNVGEAAGQTVLHVHVHVIPRYAGDRDDPRGGVRWILPERAPYWDEERRTP